MALQDKAKAMHGTAYPYAVKYAHMYAARAGSIITIVKWQRTEKVRDFLDSWDAGKVHLQGTTICPEPWATLNKTPTERTRGKRASSAITVLR